MNGVPSRGKHGLARLLAPAPWLVAALAIALGTAHAGLASPYATPIPTTGNNRSSDDPGLDNSGRYVLFTSSATNILEGATDGFPNVFVLDRSTAEIEVASVDTEENQLPLGGTGGSISGDGRFVAFNSSNTIMIRDRELGTTIDTGVNGQVDQISGNGRFLVYRTGSFADLFLMDVESRAPEFISWNGDGHAQEASDISFDGRYIVFATEVSLAPSDTDNLIDIYLRDRLLATTVHANPPAPGSVDKDAQGPSLSNDGRFVSFASGQDGLVEGDDNGMMDAFVWDRETNAYERVSVSSTGEPGDHYSYITTISGDGNRVMFRSSASNLVPGDTNRVADAFVHDRTTKQTVRVNVGSNGQQANAPIEISFDPLALNGDGTIALFMSPDAGFVPGDINGYTDVFLVDVGDMSPPSATPTPTSPAGSATPRELPQTGGPASSPIGDAWWRSAILLGTLAGVAGFGGFRRAAARSR